MAKDAGTKIDAPPSDRSPDLEEEGKQDGPDSPVGQEQGGSEPSADAGRSGAAAEEAPKPKRKRATKKTEGTAAEETGVDKAAAEASLEGAEAPAKRRGRNADEGRRAPEKERTRKPKAEAPAEEPKPAEQPQRARRREERELVTVRAQAKFVRTSARKARLIADHVRGKSVQEARSILAFSPRSVAEDWRKVLESAVANAEHNHDLVGDDLRVLNATADEGPTLKRFRPRAMGRATKIRKRTSHLTITLTPREQ